MRPDSGSDRSVSIFLVLRLPSPNPVPRDAEFGGLPMRRVFSRITLAMTAAWGLRGFSLFGAGSVQAQTTAEKTLILGAGLDLRRTA